MSRILVTGSSGFIGTHLVKRLKADGHWVRGIDIKFPEYEPSACDEFYLGDMREPDEAREVSEGMDIVYALAANMGGIGATLTHDYQLRLGNARIDQNTVESAVDVGVSQMFYASTACVYNELLQGDQAAPLKEEDVYPAQPDLAYGWMKLVNGEQLLLDAALETSLKPSIARFHNIYGTLGTWDGGKEKAPAALCRKVALAKLRGDDHIDIWGNGGQRRSFLYVDDCIDGILALTASDYHQPLNIGSDEQVSINELARMIIDIAGVVLELNHDLSKPQGVRSRNADLTRCQQVLGWTPKVSLEDGLTRTFQWIEAQVRAKYGEGTYVRHQ